MPRLRIGAHGLLLASHGKKRREKERQALREKAARESAVYAPADMLAERELNTAPRRSRSRRQRGRSVSPSAPALSALPAKLQLSMLNSGLLSVAEQERALKAIPMKPVDLSRFPRHVDQRRQYPVLFRGEWQMITKAETHTTRHASKPSNEIKNQNKKVLPFDYNRVVLETLFGIPDTDYINASYVDSILKPNAYIATQGPNEKTINDLWRLVWQEKSPCIIMLTKTFDFIKVMCNQYWPNVINSTEQYGMIQVTVTKQESLANFVVRTIKMKKADEERMVYQYHYTEWPSHCCPFSSALLEFRRRIRVFLKTIPDAGPVVVHCNDGAGRTGVFIAIDANLEFSEEDNVFDIFNYVKKLRTSRKGLVESLEQYKFIYETLEEHVVCGNSWFPLEELSQRIKYKSTRRGIKRLNEYQREYEQICKMTPKFTIGDCAGGHRLENREKNRDVIVVPPDNSRPYLSSFQGNDCTDYINAVFVDGYDHTNEYIVTEWPMKHTVGDFWSLVYDHDCKSVVILCNPSISLTPEELQETSSNSAEKTASDPHKQYPSFWPESAKSKKYGPVFTIDLMSSNHYPNVRTWIFKINKKLPCYKYQPVAVDTNEETNEVVSLTELMAGVKADAKTVQFFQFMCWPMGHKVPTSTNALVELMSMVERWRSRAGFGPVVVVSSNGRCRAGVYCAANSAIEQVFKHKEVDVFHAVKTVRRHRPQLIENITEYKYCYDLVLHYAHNVLNKQQQEEAKDNES